jgi:NTP pyrophosphatase (non-canonical NTP hydrolase)
MPTKNVTWQEAIAILHDKVGLEGLLCQLAEEASELAQAALKLRRTIVPGNPTPVTKEEAEAAVLEEVADVLLLIGILGILDDSDEIFQIQTRKMERWLNRIVGGESGK